MFLLSPCVLPLAPLASLCELILLDLLTMLFLLCFAPALLLCSCSPALLLLLSYSATLLLFSCFAALNLCGIESTKVDTPRWAPIDGSCYKLEELPGLPVYRSGWELVQCIMVIRWAEGNGPDSCEAVIRARRSGGCDRSCQRYPITM
ncbi:uncharacterized protein G2W53_017415 [Senna tora]|uniref:Uncharacterized protein n=1 Tax=Senna tora TaxID=362788 RepID=A0A834WNY5_9FABA|nr:uncharacterized protein G2W53_017415 [Senna tora]